MEYFLGDISAKPAENFLSLFLMSLYLAGFGKGLVECAKAFNSLQLVCGWHSLQIQFWLESNEERPLPNGVSHHRAVDAGDKAQALEFALELIGESLRHLRGIGV